jgi:hypothetical protein
MESSKIVSIRLRNHLQVEPKALTACHVHCLAVDFKVAAFSLFNGVIMATLNRKKIQILSLVALLSVLPLANTQDSKGPEHRKNLC